MEGIPILKRTKIVEICFACNSVVLSQCRFCAEFPGKHCPCVRTIKRLVDKFRNTGNLNDDHNGQSGRPVSVRTETNIQAVRDHLQQSPRKAIRRLSQEVRISWTSVERIVHKDLTMFPCKIQVLQQQTDANKKRKDRILHFST